MHVSILNTPLSETLNPHNSSVTSVLCGAFCTCTCVLFVMWVKFMVFTSFMVMQRLLLTDKPFKMIAGLLCHSVESICGDTHACKHCLFK